MARKSINIQAGRGGGLIVKGVSDSSFGQQPAQNAVAPKAVKNSLGRLTPIEAWTLSSEVHTAVHARNQPFNQTHIRLFTKGGEEVTAGPAFEFFAKPNPSQSGPSMLQAVSYWSDISGERAAYMRYGDNGRQIAHVLNPMSLAFLNPVLPQFPEDIIRWRYTWDNGLLQSFNADEVIRDIDWNPSSLCRGQSPLYTVVNDVDSVYRAVRYLRSFFTNGSRPSNIINVDTENPDQVEPFKEQYVNAMQGEANAWHSFFTYGKKVTVTPLDAPVPDGPNNPIQLLIKNVRDKVAALYMVPPLHGGMWDQTKFDSVAEQNDFFYESVFIPRGLLIQSWAQMILDGPLRFATPSGRRKPKLTHFMRQRLDKAINESQSDLVIVLDFDHIPAVAALKRHKVLYAQELQNTFKLTPKASAMEVGMEDLDMSPAAELVWYPSNTKFIEGDPKTKPGEITSVPIPSEEDAETTGAGPNGAGASPKKMKALRNFFRGLRNLSMASVENEGRWTLAEADTLSKEHGVACEEVRKFIRFAHAHLSPLQRTKNKDGIRDYLNREGAGPRLQLMAKAMNVELNKANDPNYSEISLDVIVDPKRINTEDERNRRKALLLLLLGYFQWQAEVLNAAPATPANAPAFTAKLSALLTQQMTVGSLATLSSGGAGGAGGTSGPLPTTTPPSIFPRFEPLKPGTPQWESASDFVSEEIPALARRLAGLLNDTTQKNIDAAIKGGATPTEAIDVAVTKAVLNRATLIEDDANHIAATVGIAAWYKSDSVNLLQWVTERDDKVCSICGPLDGLHAKPGGEFMPGIRWPVLDTHGRCRCTVKEASDG